MAEAVAGSSAEIGRDEASSWLEDAEYLGEATVLELRREVVKHHARERHVEMIVRRRDRLDRGNLKRGRGANARGLSFRQRDHFGGGIDAHRRSGGTSRLRRGERQPTRSTPDVQDALAGSDCRQFDHRAVEGPDAATT